MFGPRTQSVTVGSVVGLSFAKLLSEAVGMSDSATPTLVAGGGSITHGSQLDATNTGLAGAGVSEGTLTTVAGATYSTNGQTISGKKFTDTVSLTGNGITLQNCLFEIPGGANNKAIINTGVGNLVQDVTIRTISGSLYMCVHHTGGSGLTLRRVNATSAENIVTCEADTLTIDTCYLWGTSIASNPTGHADVVEIYGGNGIVISKSRLAQTAGLGDSPINIAPWFGAVSVDGVTVSDTYIQGGNSHLLVDVQSTGTIHNVKVLRCRMDGKTDNGSYNPFQDNDGRGTVQTPAAQVSTPNAVLWPNTGADLSTWYNCAPLSPDRSGQTIVA